jgi:dTDP-4-amino-4,6-dideoxygalactose transaminase
VKLLETENFCNRELTLPLHPSLSEKDIDRIVKSLGRAVYWNK